jgi:hypothetical protein
MNPLWTLAPLGALAGAAGMWAFLRIADTAALGAAANRIQAHLLEAWLFVDEPSLIWKTWRGLLAANARFLGLLLLPLAVLSVPMTPLLFLLDSQYGYEPLAVGKPALVTIGVNQPLAGLPHVPELAAPEGIAVESPALRVWSEREVSWRVRPERAVSGTLRCTVGGATVEKSVAAGAGPAYLSRKRTARLLEIVRYPTEAPLRAGPVEWIEVGYPATEVGPPGWETHWSAWFFGFSLIGAVALPRGWRPEAAGWAPGRGYLLRKGRKSPRSKPQST